jgi:hypothetical protein
MFLGDWMGGWVDGWLGVKAILRIAYSNQKYFFSIKRSRHAENFGPVFEWSVKLDHFK